MLELRDISRVFERGGDRAGVFGASLEVPPGCLAVLAGPSGSGKTTLLQVAGLLDAPDAGEVHLEGRRVDALPEAERTRIRLLRLGFVFQSFNLIPVLSALENAALPLELAGRPVEAARELLERVGLGERLQHRPAQLSGGQQQRVAIARALANGPALVLADEPTAALDHAHGGPLIELMRDLARERGTSFLVASHDPAVIAAADRVFRLEDGRLAC